MNYYFKDENGNRINVYSIQGADFSKNGRLYLARYDGDGPWDNYLFFSAFSGID